MTPQEDKSQEEGSVSIEQQQAHEGGSGEGGDEVNISSPATQQDVCPGSMNNGTELIQKPADLLIDYKGLDLKETRLTSLLLREALDLYSEIENLSIHLPAHRETAESDPSNQFDVKLWERICERWPKLKVLKLFNIKDSELEILFKGLHQLECCEFGLSHHDGFSLSSLPPSVTELTLNMPVIPDSIIKILIGTGASGLKRLSFISAIQSLSLDGIKTIFDGPLMELEFLSLYPLRFGQDSGLFPSQLTQVFKDSKIDKLQSISLTFSSTLRKYTIDEAVNSLTERWSDTLTSLSLILRNDVLLTQKAINAICTNANRLKHLSIVAADEQGTGFNRAIEIQHLFGLPSLQRLELESIKIFPDIVKEFLVQRPDAILRLNYSGADGLTMEHEKNLNNLSTIFKNFTFSLRGQTIVNKDVTQVDSKFLSSKMKNMSIANQKPRQSHRKL